jgi:hypothetical protein
MRVRQACGAEAALQLGGGRGVRKASAGAGGVAEGSPHAAAAMQCHHSLHSPPLPLPLPLRSRTAAGPYASASQCLLSCGSYLMGQRSTCRQQAEGGGR